MTDDSNIELQTLINVTDNGDEDPEVTFNLQGPFHIGEHAIRVTARDGAGNVAKCRFTISIQGEINVKHNVIC